MYLEPVSMSDKYCWTISPTRFSQTTKAFFGISLTQPLTIKPNYLMEKFNELKTTLKIPRKLF